MQTFAEALRGPEWLAPFLIIIAPLMLGGLLCWARLGWRERQFKTRSGTGAREPQPHQLNANSTAWSYGILRPRVMREAMASEVNVALIASSN